MSTLQSAPTRARLIVGSLLIGLLVVYWPTWIELGQRWRLDSSSYSHGMLVVLISAFLLVRDAPLAAASEDDRWKRLGIIGLASVSLFWSLAYLANVLILQAALMPMVILLTFGAIFGRAALRAFWFPALFLYTAFPVWFLVLPVLQKLTIVAVSNFVAAVGIPALIHGEYVEIPAGMFQIESGCAGLHFFLVALMIGSLFAYFELLSWKTQLLFLIVSIAASMVMNWIRVATIIVAGHVTDMQHYLVTVDHYVFGWVLFAVMLVPLFAFGSILARKQSLSANDNSAPFRDGGRRHPIAGVGRLAFVLLVFSAIPAATYALDYSSQQLSLRALTAPPLGDGWQFSSGRLDAWTPQFQEPDSEMHGHYRRSDMSIGVYMNRYVKQSQGRELVSTVNSVLGRLDGSVVSRSYRTVTSNGSELPIVVDEVSTASGEKFLLVHWYQVGSYAATRPFRLKVLDVVARLSGQPASGVVALRVQCGMSCSDALARLSEFVSLHGKELAESVKGQSLNGASAAND